MKILLGWLVFCFLVLILPIYAHYIYNRIRADGWVTPAKHSALALLIASIIFVLLWYGLAPQTPAEAKTAPSLQILTKKNLDDEVAVRKQQGQFAMVDPDRALHVMKEKFEEADYAQQKNDLDRALRLYAEVERGSDQNGPFDNFSSACIKNNMAAAYFRKYHNKGFKASILLLDALRLEPKPQDLKSLIQQNIDALDPYVNE
jgi:hypothetical protein